jgi:hypothetical protein
LDFFVFLGLGYVVGSVCSVGEGGDGLVCLVLRPVFVSMLRFVSFGSDGIARV